MFRRMTNERQRIISSVIQLVYFMRGAVQYKDMMHLTTFEREAMAEFIEKRIEIEGKKMYPIY